MSAGRRVQGRRAAALVATGILAPFPSCSSCSIHTPPPLAPNWQDTYKDRWLECARRAFAELDADGSGRLSADEIAAAFGTHLSPYEVRWPGLTQLARGLGAQAWLCPGWPWQPRAASSSWAGCMRDAPRLLESPRHPSTRLRVPACLPSPQVDAALHHALLEATGGHAAARPSAVAAAGEVTWEADGGGSGGGTVDFDHFLAMLRDGGGADDLLKFDDRLSNHTSRQPSLHGDTLPVVPGSRRQRSMPRMASGADGGCTCCVIS